MTAAHKPPGSVWLFDLAAALTILTALIYATGWTYAYHYFSRFHLGLLHLKIPVEYCFMYGFWVFKDAWPWLLLLSLLAVVAAWLRTRCGIGCRIQRVLSFKSLQVLAVILGFVFAGWLAQRSAAHYYQTQRARGFDAYPHVQLWLRSPSHSDATLAAIAAVLRQGEFRLLLQTDNTLFVFKPPPAGDPAQITVTQLAAAEVQMLRLSP